MANGTFEIVLFRNAPWNKTVVVFVCLTFKSLVSIFHIAPQNSIYIRNPTSKNCGRSKEGKRYRIPKMFQALLECSNYNMIWQSYVDYQLTFHFDTCLKYLQSAFQQRPYKKLTCSHGIIYSFNSLKNTKKGCEQESMT